MDRGHRGDAECVALAAPYGHALVERGPLGGLQSGRAQEVGDLARHVEGDRGLRCWGVLVIVGVLGHEVGDGGADGAAADVVVAGQAGDGLAAQVSGAHGGGLRARDGRAASALAALGLGGPQSVVGQLALEFAARGHADTIAARGIVHRLADQLPHRLHSVPLRPRVYDHFTIVHRRHTTLSRATRTLHRPRHHPPPAGEALGRQAEP
ncbi:hypothetical protein [Streptomyces sp. NPDC050388]|uniref:hypothetical protein n=1 Tax=Streptomyces sp. NPDC050388 TaxID=3155781 RepID=UPI00344A1362